MYLVTKVRVDSVTKSCKFESLQVTVSKVSVRSVQFATLRFLAPQNFPKIRGVPICALPVKLIESKNGFQNTSVKLNSPRGAHPLNLATRQWWCISGSGGARRENTMNVDCITCVYSSLRTIITREGTTLCHVSAAQGLARASVKCATN